MIALIPKPLLLAAVIALAALVGVQSWRLQAEQLNHAETRQEFAQAAAAASEAARLAEAEAREEEQRRIAALQEITNEARKREAQALADAAAARNAGERLRAQLNSLVASRGASPGDSSPATGSPPADATVGMLADLLARADERAGILATHADAARSAGEACQRSYEALTR